MHLICDNKMSYTSYRSKINSNKPKDGIVSNFKFTSDHKAGVSITSEIAV